MKIPYLTLLIMSGAGALLSVLSGCAPSTNQSNENLEEDAAIETSVGSLNNVLSDVEQNSSYAYLLDPPGKIENFFSSLVIPKSHAAYCDINRFEPMPSLTATCEGTEDDKTVILTFDGCDAYSRWRGSKTGTVRMVFDTPETCDEWINRETPPTSGYVTRTTSDLTWENTRGVQLSISSDSHENYLGEMIEGGKVVHFLDVNNDGEYGRSVQILGANRTLTNPKDEVIRDHSIMSVENIVSYGDRNGALIRRRKVQSGQLKVFDNIKEKTYTTTFEDLEWDDSCCLPVSGSVSIESINSEGTLQTRIVDFGYGDCDQAQVNRTSSDRNDELERIITFSSCE